MYYVKKAQGYNFFFKKQTVLFSRRNIFRPFIGWAAAYIHGHALMLNMPPRAKYVFALNLLFTSPCKTEDIP